MVCEQPIICEEHCVLGDEINVHSYVSNIDFKEKNHFISSMEINPLSCRGLLSVNESKKTLLKRERKGGQRERVQSENRI